MFDKIMKNVEVDSATGCFNYTGWRDKGGYGRIYVYRNGSRQNIGVHRIIWEEVNGPIPDGMFILHSCDNPRCCNPEHLSIGNAAENSRDIVRRNRMPKGMEHGSSVLSDSEAITIRQMFDQGVPIKTIARKFNVSRNAVRMIGKRQTWTHLPEKSIDGVMPLFQDVLPPSKRTLQYEPRHAARRDSYP